MDGNFKTDRLQKLTNGTKQIGGFSIGFCPFNPPTIAANVLVDLHYCVAHVNNLPQRTPLLVNVEHNHKHCTQFALPEATSKSLVS